MPDVLDLERTRSDYEFIRLGTKLVPDHEPEPYWIWSQFEGKNADANRR